MKLAAFLGSGNKNGNTAKIMKKVIEGAQANGIDHELFYLCDYHIKPCIGCRACEKTHQCRIKDDDVPILHKALMECDAILMGTPTYYGDVTGQYKQFVDRVYPFIDIKKDLVNKTLYFGSILTKKKPGILVAITGGHSEEILERHTSVTKHCFNDINAYLWKELLVPYTTWEPISENHPIMPKAYEVGLSLADILRENFMQKAE
jgi:multimeric flavodoxin WrbA